LINLTNSTCALHEVPPDKALPFIAGDDHEMHITSLVIIVTRLFEYVG